jgi:hypothetical protein
MNAIGGKKLELLKEAADAVAQVTVTLKRCRGGVSARTGNDVLFITLHERVKIRRRS